MVDPDKFLEMFGKIERIDERTLDSAKKLEQLASKQEVKALSSRVDDLESGKKWALRMSIGAVVGVVVTMVKTHIGWSS